MKEVKRSAHRQPHELERLPTVILQRPTSLARLSESPNRWRQERDHRAVKQAHNRMVWYGSQSWGKMGDNRQTRPDARTSARSFPAEQVEMLEFESNSTKPATDTQACW